MADICLKVSPSNCHSKKRFPGRCPATFRCFQGTISRVINNPEKVAAKSRMVVNASIEALGYIPDGTARALASRHSGIIGAVLPTLDTAIRDRYTKPVAQAYTA